MLHLRPQNPKAHRKVERSHQELRKKIHDGDDEDGWRRNYLGRKSTLYEMFKEFVQKNPFEIYFGGENHEICRAGARRDNEIEMQKVKPGARRDYEKNKSKTKSI